MALTQRNGIWHWRKEIDGVKFARSTKTSDEKLAKEIVRRWEHEAVQQVVIQGVRPITLHQGIDLFVQSRKNTAGYESMELHMRNWKKMADKPMLQVREDEVSDHIAAMRKTINHNNMVVRIRYWNAMQNLCAARRLTSGPKIKPWVPEATKLRFLTEAEEQALYSALAVPDQYPGKCARNDACKQDNQDLMVCLLHLGARISEAEKLRWADVDFEHNTIYVRRLKRGNHCLLVMSERLRGVMERRRFADPQGVWVFPAKQSKQTNRQWIHGAIRRAGIDETSGVITSHVFRHTAATWLLRSGADILQVKTFLGHKSLASSLCYLHTIPTEVAHKAAAMFDR